MLLFVLFLFTQCETHEGFKEIMVENLEGKWELLEFRGKHKEWIDNGDTEYLEIFDNIWKKTYIDDYSYDEFYEPPTNETTITSFKYRLIDEYIEVYIEYSDGEKEMLYRYRIEHICENELVIKTIRNELLPDILFEYKYVRVH